MQVTVVKPSSATMIHQTTKSSNLPSILVFLLHLSLLFLSSTSETQKNYLNRGSSLSVEDDSDILISTDKTFTCGFYSVGENAYWFSIWFTNSNDRTVVWMANRDKPVNAKGSKVSLRGDGTMVLTDVDDSIAWETNTTFTAVQKAELLNNGNLVLKDPHGKILWQSFDFPTDTLLPTQTFTKSKKLISKFGKGYFSSGYYNFYFDNDNVLRLMHDGPDISSIYWPNPEISIFDNGRTNYNSSRIAKFDDMGRFLSSDQLFFNAADMGLGIKRRLTLDFDGNLRLYSLNNSTGNWSVTWVALVQRCRIHGVCGRNGICAYTPLPKCSCPPGYEMNIPSNWNQGCKAKFNKTCNPKTHSRDVKFVELLNTDYFGFDLNFTRSTSFEACKKMCLDSCLCDGFSYRLTGTAMCFTKSALFNGFRTQNFEGTIYLKVPASFKMSESSSTLNSSDPVCMPGGTEIQLGFLTMYDTSSKRVKWNYFYWFAAAIGGIELFCAIAGWWFLYRKQGLPDSVEDGYRALSSQFRRFTYTELKKATKNFKEELGRGSSGAVYKGVLADKRVVAVKRLGDVIEGDEVFWAEVSTIGKIFHMNLLRMWGFCSQNQHKLLVYEYIENRSLDRHLFGSNSLGWNMRFGVAMGAAKGLAYLHHECLEWVIHCDVKPENILLDSEFAPKIADFGLAKLFQREGGPNSEFSRIRGTKGYMAPEWALNLPITAKVDVYSYGVVILELVKGTRLSNWVVKDGDDDDDDDGGGGGGRIDEVELTRLVRVVKKRKLECIEDSSWIEDIVDPRLEGKFSRSQAAAMVEIGISCVEEDRNKRPTMASVVQLLLECEATEL